MAADAMLRVSRNGGFRSVRLVQTAGERARVEGIKLWEVGRIAGTGPVSDIPGMILINAGSFPVEGSRLFGNKKPAQTTITISRDFLLGEFPVTVEEYREFAEATNHLSKIEGQQGAEELKNLLNDRSKDRHPVVFVNPADRRAYAEWKGERFYVPTAAEWELAARGEKGRLFPYGNEWKKALYYNKDRTFPVDSFPAGATPDYGLKGFGIVWEAVSTLYGDYDPKITTDPKGPEKGEYIEVRGGSAWNNNQYIFHGSYRYYFLPDYREHYGGFRLAARTLTCQNLYL